jgi:RND family efflux transporter MFP subunit
MFNSSTPALRRVTVIVGLSLAFAVVAADTLPTDTGFDCIITPSHTVDLGSAVPGQLQEVTVDRGDRVTAGQIVARLDSRVEQANLSIARFKADTDTELRLREAALVIDRRAEERLVSLASSQVASAQERDRVAREAKLSAWRTQLAKDSLALYALEVARAESLLDRLNIRSPIDGVVMQRMANAGQYIENDPIMRLVSLDPLHVEAILPMRLFGKVRPGDAASIVPELDDGGRYPAVVARVDPMGDAASGTFGLRLTLENPGDRIPAGLRCRLLLESREPRLSQAGR